MRRVDGGVWLREGSRFEYRKLLCLDLELCFCVIPAMDALHSRTGEEFSTRGVEFGGDSRASEEVEGGVLFDFLYSSCYWYGVTLVSSLAFGL